MKSVTEWSAEFDILWNNIMSNQAPGLSEYEKSVFLTRAQEAVVVGIYRGTISVPFESTEEVTDYLSPLVSQANGSLVDSGVHHIVPDSVVYKLPDDLLFRTYESCTVSTDCGDANADVVPVTQDEFWRTHRDPFKKQNSRRVLRLSYSDITLASGNASMDAHTQYSELVSDAPINAYLVRYIKKPEPIILAAIDEGYPAINGERAVKTCKLHENLHQTILAEAVNMAKVVWASS